MSGIRAVVVYGLLAALSLGGGGVMLARAWHVASVWDEGVVAEGATYDGSMSLYVVAAAYDLVLHYRDESGAEHRDGAFFVRIFERPGIDAFGLPGAPYEVRYDPRDPSDAVISWEHAGRWELGGLGLLFFLGGLGMILQIVSALRGDDDE